LKCPKFPPYWASALLHTIIPFWQNHAEMEKVVKNFRNFWGAHEPRAENYAVSAISNGTS